MRMCRYDGRGREGCTVEEKSLSDEGRDPGLAGAVVEQCRCRCTRVDVGDSLEGVVTDGKEAGRTGRVEQDSRGTLVGSGTSWQAARGGGRRDAGDREVGVRLDGEFRRLLGHGVGARLRPGRGADMLSGGREGMEKLRVPGM